MADPFREQRIPPAEVRRVLRRAAELAESDPETPATEKSLTRVEIERSAEELGIPATAIARALESNLDASSAPQKISRRTDAHRLRTRSRRRAERARSRRLDGRD